MFMVVNIKFPLQSITLITERCDPCSSLFQPADNRCDTIGKPCSLEKGYALLGDNRKVR